MNLANESHESTGWAGINEANESDESTAANESHHANQSGESMSQMSQPSISMAKSIKLWVLEVNLCSILIKIIIIL